MTEPGAAPITEIDLCRAWLRLPRSIALTTTTGQSVDVIHLGTWTHGLGPDFRDAIVAFDGGPAQHGSVELHLRSRGWIDHRHHLDPRYNDVILHVAGADDSAEIRRADGKVIPTVVLDIQATAGASSAADWSIVGGDVCAERLSRENPGLIRGILARLGDARMTARAARIESLLTDAPPEAVLYAEVLDALGYASNRQPMRELVERLPWHVVTALPASGGGPFAGLCATLLGAAGFLPMSDREIGLAGLEPAVALGLAEDWRGVRSDWGIEPLPATSWSLARIRPANHPIRRLVQAAAIMAGSALHPGSRCLGRLREGSDPTEDITDLVESSGAPAIGRDRARAMTTNVLIPFGFAVASQSADSDLAERTARLWESLPAAESNERTRRAIRQVTGDVGLKRFGARVHQGLIHLDQTLCAPRRCYECPIAATVVHDAAAPGTLLS